MSEPFKQLTSFTFHLPDNLKLGERSRRILALRFDHPEWSHEELGKAVGVSYQRVGQILSNPRVLDALPALARQRKKSLTPRALRSYEGLLVHDNAIVRERAAAKILTENKVFDVPESKTTVEITLKSVSELQTIIQKASQLPPNVIDAEVVQDQTPE